MDTLDFLKDGSQVRHTPERVRAVKFPGRRQRRMKVSEVWPEINDIQWYDKRTLL